MLGQQNRVGRQGTLLCKKINIAVADPEGVQGVRSNPSLELNYFIFMGNFRKNEEKHPPFLNLNPLFSNPGSAPVLVTFSVPINSLCEVKTSLFIAVFLPN